MQRDDNTARGSIETVFMLYAEATADCVIRLHVKVHIKIGEGGIYVACWQQENMFINIQHHINIIINTRIRCAKLIPGFALIVKSHSTCMEFLFY